MKHVHTDNGIVLNRRLETLNKCGLAGQVTTFDDDQHGDQLYHERIVKASPSVDRLTSVGLCVCDAVDRGDLDAVSCVHPHSQPS